MKATILPLEDGKYYGSEVSIIDDAGHDYRFKLWHNASYEPSDRELNGICTIDQWRNNEILTIDYEELSAKEVVNICNSHFESRETYQLAKKLVEMINGNTVHADTNGTNLDTLLNELVSVSVGKTKGGIFGSGC